MLFTMGERGNCPREKLPPGLDKKEVRLYKNI